MITGGPDIPFLERGAEVSHAEESEAEARKSIFEIWSKYGESQKASNEGKQEENKALPAEQTEDTVIEDNASVEYVITDKNVTISEGKSLTGNDTFQVYVAKGQVV